MTENTSMEAMTKAVDEAFRRAARIVIERARQTGTPVIVWENGQIVRRSPDSFDLGPDPPADQRKIACEF